MKLLLEKRCEGASLCEAAEGRSLPKCFAQNLRPGVPRFAQAFGVRTRPRIAFMC